MDLAAKVEELIKLTNSLKQELNELRGKDLNTKLEELEKEMAELKNEINDLRYCLMKQNAKILAMIHRLPKPQPTQEIRKDESPIVIQNKISNYSKIFPLSSLADLEKLEESLDVTNTQEIIIILQRLLTPKGISKNINYVLSTDLIMECNMDGMHKKIRLLKYSKFIDALFQAVYTDGYSLKGFMSDMRRGLKIVKHRQSKVKVLRTPAASKQSKSQNQGQEDDDEYGYESNNYEEDDDELSSQPDSIIKIEDTVICGD